MTASSDLYASVNLGARGTSPQDYLRAAQELMERETPDSHFVQLEEFRQKLDGEMRELDVQQKQFARFYESLAHPIDGSETIANSTQMSYLRKAFDSALLTSVELRGRVQTLRDVKLAVAKAREKALASTFSGTTSQTWKEQLEALERRVTTNYNTWLDLTTNRCQTLYANYVFICERRKKSYASYPLASRLRDAFTSWRSYLPENWQSSSANTDSDFIGSYLPIPKEVSEQVKKTDSLDLDSLVLLRLRLLGVYYKAPKTKRGEMEAHLKKIDRRIHLLKLYEAQLKNIDQQLRTLDSPKKKKDIYELSLDELTVRRDQVFGKLSKDEDPEGKAEAYLHRVDMHLAKHRAINIASGEGRYPENIKKFYEDLCSFSSANRFFKDEKIKTVLETTSAIIQCKYKRVLSLSALYTATKKLEALKTANGEDYTDDLRNAAAKSFDSIKNALKASPPKNPKELLNTLAALNRCHNYFGQSDFGYLKEVMTSAKSNLKDDLKKHSIVFFDELQILADLLKVAGKHFVDKSAELEAYRDLFIAAMDKCNPERTRREQQSFIQMLYSVAIYCGSHQAEIQEIADKYRGKLQ